MDDKLRHKMSQVEALLHEKENFMKRIRDNEMSFAEICKHVNEAKSRAEKERDELNKQIDELKTRMQSQSALIEELSDQVGAARKNVVTQKEQLESYLDQQLDEFKSANTNTGDADAAQQSEEHQPSRAE